MRCRCLREVLIGVALAASVSAMTAPERRAYVEWMLRELPAAPGWAEWQRDTGTLPPDFDALPRENYLPDPFRFHDGRTVTMPAEWPVRRAEIRQLLETHMIGRLPPKPPLARIVPVKDANEGGVSTRVVRLEFGPGGHASTEVTLILPPGRGPFPVVIGDGWARNLIRRGYASCRFAGSVDEPSNLPQLYSDFDFSAMGERAWIAQLVVDYLLTLPEIDAARIAITGYSREGKMATIAAALDERIAAVIAGSTGVGGVLPWRLAGERGMGESIESTTRMFPRWFAPQLRFFAGREDRLPVDANLLVALIAPRACLMQYGLNDEVSSVWGNEQAYHSALRVYDALGGPDRLGLLRIPGFHGGNDPERCLDWLDIQFGRSRQRWQNDLLFPWSFADWRERSGRSVDLPRAPRPPALESATSLAATEAVAAEIRRAIEWMLGEPPPELPASATRTPFRGFPDRAIESTPTHPLPNPGQLAPDVPAWVHARGIEEFGWKDPERAAVDSMRFRFGARLIGDLYFPAGADAAVRRPTVIWLHGYSYPLGYMWVYRRDVHPILALVRAGYAVLAFDQCGFGSRMAELAPFYERHPQWSQLGRMVEDVRHAIDALERQPHVDPQRIYLLGYSLGGTVALHAAALERRVRGVVSVAGFTPLRADTTGAVGRLSVERPVLPRLGLFAERPAEIPYDYDELLAAIAPRPVLIVQPTMDRDADPAAVRAAVGRARKVYSLHDAPERLTLHEPVDYQRFPAAMQDRAIAWLEAHAPPR